MSNKMSQRVLRLNSQLVSAKAANAWLSRRLKRSYNLAALLILVLALENLALVMAWVLEGLL